MINSAKLFKNLKGVCSLKQSFKIHGEKTDRPDRTNASTIRVREFNTSLSGINRTGRHKVNEDTYNWIQNNNQPRCPSVSEWIKKMWHIYNEYYSVIKRNETLPFVTTWVDTEGIMISEVIKSDPER